MSTKPPTLPGFNAEAVLYRTSGHYRSVASQSYHGGEHGVIQIAARSTGCTNLGNAMQFWMERAGNAAANGNWWSFNDAMVHVSQAAEVYELADC